MRMITKKMLAKHKMYAHFRDLEKAYDRIGWEAMWDVLRVYGVGRRLLDGMKAFYRDANACVKVKGQMGERFKMNAGVRQGCIMSQWLFELFLDGVVRQLKAYVRNVGVQLSTHETKQKLNTMLSANGTVLPAVKKIYQNW